MYDLTPTPNKKSNQDSLLPEYWKWWDVYPVLSEYALQVYDDAIANGRNPHAFSIIGDCQSEPNIFMGRFDTGDYVLPENEAENLSETISYYKGMFNRNHITVKDGLSVFIRFCSLME